MKEGEKVRIAGHESARSALLEMHWRGIIDERSRWTVRRRGQTLSGIPPRTAPAYLRDHRPCRSGTYVVRIAIRALREQQGHYGAIADRSRWCTRSGSNLTASRFGPAFQTIHVHAPTGDLPGTAQVSIRIGFNFQKQTIPARPITGQGQFGCNERMDWAKMRKDPTDRLQ